MKQASDWNDEIHNDPGMASDLTALINDIQEDAFKAGVEYACRLGLKFNPQPGSEAERKALDWMKQPLHDHPNDLA